MKFKIKRILSVLLVFCMMMGLVPNMLMTAHAASGALTWGTESNGDHYVQWDTDEFGNGAFLTVKIEKDGTQLEGFDGNFTTHAYDNKLNVSQQIRNVAVVVMLWKLQAVERLSNRLQRI